MLDGLKGTLGRLRNVFARKAEDAYDDRDAASSPSKESYAAGEAHAYGVAADEVRDAEKRDE